jgi:tetratricopeptide (TPR) repeat protein
LASPGDYTKAHSCASLVATPSALCYIYGMSRLTASRRIFGFLAAVALVLPLGAQQPAPAHPSAAQANPNAAQQVIQNPAEYKAYMAALNTQDAAARGAAMEAFAQQYPQSAVLVNALEYAMAAWQSAGNSAKVEELARRLLALEPGDVRALAVVVAFDRAKATQGDADALGELCLHSSAGLREVLTWQKPAGMTAPDFDRLSRQMSQIFNGAAGFCALQSKDYSQARDWLTRAFALDPSSLQDVYQLALADLQMAPLDPNGFWYCARAIHLAQGSAGAKATDGMAVYCKAKYKTYRGTEDGWDALMTASAAQSALPPDFARQITPAPAPTH